MLKDALKEIDLKMEKMVEASANKKDQALRELLKDALKEIDVKMEEMVEASTKNKEQAMRKLATAPW
jgi:hypothetical protein